VIVRNLFDAASAPSFPSVSLEGYLHAVVDDAIDPIHLPSHIGGVRVQYFTSHVGVVDSEVFKVAVLSIGTINIKKIHFKGLGA